MPYLIFYTLDFAPHSNTEIPDINCFITLFNHMATYSKAVTTNSTYRVQYMERYDATKLMQSSSIMNDVSLHYILVHLFFDESLLY